MPKSHHITSIFFSRHPNMTPLTAINLLREQWAIKFHIGIPYYLSRSPKKQQQEVCIVQQEGILGKAGQFVVHA